MPSKSIPSRERRKVSSDKPPKPYPEFPLGAHASGAWCKKIRGKFHYFGKWGKLRDGKMERLPDDGWQAALALYKEQADDLHAGRTPRVKGDGLTVRDLCNAFLTAKLRQRDAGEITSRTYDEYRATTDLLIEKFGKERFVGDLSAGDFEALRDGMAKQWGPVRLGNEVQKVRTVFKYGYETGLIEKPVRYGPQFKKPSASVLRRHRAANGERMIEADELRRLLDAAPIPLKAMILLGVNCGLGNHDIALLPLSALDLDGGWLKFPRPKTGIERHCPLWSETVTALKAAITERPTPTNDATADKVFLTVRGRQWLSRGIANPVSVAARKLMKTAGINRAGVGFYTLRHVFRTVADGCRDQVATNHIMGHADGSMAAVYRERIDDSRLRAVVEYVHAWVWPVTADKPQGDAEHKTKDKSKANSDRSRRQRIKPQPVRVESCDVGPRFRIVG